MQRNECEDTIETRLQIRNGDKKKRLANTIRIGWVTLKMGSTLCTSNLVLSPYIYFQVAAALGTDEVGFDVVQLDCNKELSMKIIKQATTAECKITICSRGYAWRSFKSHPE